MYNQSGRGEKMNYPYTINDLARNCQVSNQSIYNLIKKNKDFVNENSTRKQRKIYYNQEVMVFFLSYYGQETTESSLVSDHGAEKRSTEGEKSLSGSSSTDEPATSRIKALESEIERKDAEITRLNDLLTAKEAERKELLTQNGALILTIQQLQQEKMLLLPAPRKPIGEKIKGLFNRKT